MVAGANFDPRSSCSQPDKPITLFAILFKVKKKEANDVTILKC